MKRSVLLLAVIAGVAIAFGVFSGSGRADGIQVGATVENFSLPDLNGETKSLNDLKGKNGTVLVWLSAQCPVVKGYNDRILEISEEFRSKGINFVGINSNATESLDWVKSNASEVGYKFPILIDKNNVLADKFAASVTPEIYYFDAKNVLLYHGAIDNDRSGRNITTQYLRDAADSALGGKAIATTRANAFGCTIKRAEKQ